MRMTAFDLRIAALVLLAMFGWRPVVYAIALLMGWL